MSAWEEGVVFTAQAGAEQCARNELQRTGLRMADVRWLDAGVGWAAAEGGFARLAAVFAQELPIFIRHICPAQVCVPHGGQAEVPALLAEAAWDAFGAHIDRSRRFSVQAVFLREGDTPYKRFDVHSAIAGVFAEHGATLDVTRPEQVISVTHLPDRAYLGLSEAADNLSDWAGGAHRFAHEAGQISRAEFKLLEAIEVFRLRLPAQGTALDLGAAPGGWTRVLRAQGLAVVAVDPAALDERVAADPGVTHFRGTAQKYLQDPAMADIIVNDMRMDARESAHIMGSVAACLREGGLAVMTLKLPQQGMQRQAAQAMALLRRWYDVAGARQLFHNRAEITVVLRPKGAAQ